jgi:thiosulfate/3-mercaptopyruvate sulfurtransferase
MKLDGPLVTTQWLEDHLGDATLRIYDTSIFLTHKEDGFGYIPVSGREEWLAEHIPGAGFLDVIEELSDRSNAIPFMMPPPDLFASVMASRGVSDDSAVVLYNKGFPMWSTRVWWMLRSIGFERVAVLDGGWEKWRKEERPVSDAPPDHPAGRLTPRARRDMWVDKDDMLAMIDAGSPVTINALSPAVYSGEKNQYGRPGHLPGTHNVFYGDLIDADTGEFLPPEALRKLFEGSGALDGERVITYCGGGISATMDSLALMLCGQARVAVYDGSMSEWVKDESLPLKLGSEP